MDADLWHTWCTAENVAEPQALTLSQWKKLTPSKREVHVKRLKSWLLQMYLETDQLAAAAKTITKVVEDNACRPCGTKDIVVLTGPNLVGKSTLMMRWGRAQYLSWTCDAVVDCRGRPVRRISAYCEADLVPVVWIDLRSVSMTSTIDRKLNKFLGQTSYGTNDALGITAENALKRHGALVVIIDDIHLAWFERRLGRQVLDHIKHMNTELGQIGASLILVGANLEDTALVNDPQISGRMKLVTLKPYEIKDDRSQQEVWQRVVKQLEDRVLPHLPADKPEVLYRLHVGELWYRSGGYLKHLIELVIEATLAASRDGTHRITRELLSSIELSDGAGKNL